MTTALDLLQQRFTDAVAELEPFDAQVWLGRSRNANRAYTTTAEIRAALSGSIRRGLVSHTMSLLHDWERGNDALAHALTDLPDCAGVMALVPAAQHTHDDLEAAVDRWLAHGLRTARLTPKAHRFSLRVPTAKPLIQSLERRGMPLLVPIGETSWDEVGALATAYPRLAILVESTGHHEYLNVRAALPWLEQAPNLLVPTNRQFLMGGVELMVERLGERRVLFASNQPIDDPSAALGVLAFSGLSIDTRRRIARGNLDDLLASVGHGGYLA